MQTEPRNSETPKRDWSATLDLNRSTAIKSFVDRMEECMRQAEAARDDLKEILAEAKEAEFGRRDIEAMKKIAQLRLRDMREEAAGKLAALRRIGDACQFDLFGEADAED